MPCSQKGLEAGEPQDEAAETSRASCLGAAAGNTLQPFPLPRPHSGQRAPGEGPDWPSHSHWPTPGQGALTLSMPSKYQRVDAGRSQDVAWPPAFQSRDGRRETAPSLSTDGGKEKQLKAWCHWTLSFGQERGGLGT